MGWNRREFLKVGGAASLGFALSPKLAWAQPYTVGIGRDTDPYAATMRAVLATGEWPPAPLAGARVIIKPNLVSALPSTSGATTDPEVARAVVDLVLQQGAASVDIVESAPNGANFSACGYDSFATYDPLGRIRLIDLKPQPVTLASVPGGAVYSKIYVPTTLLDPSAVFISVGKMKTHTETAATLSSKNLFGVPAVDRYISVPDSGRFSMHDRGLQQAIVDLLRLRRIDFAVVDGIWGMEGAGPIFGTPKRADTVLAGRDSIAVDRAALQVMAVPQAAPRYLAFANRTGRGPADLSSVTLVGDPLQQVPFTVPPLSPIIEYPRLYPSAVFSPGAGQTTTALVWYNDTVVRSLDVLQLYDDTPTVTLVRTLQPLANHAAGYETAVWDGRADDGTLVAPGRYAVHVRAFNTRARVRHADAMTWIDVQ